jgi:lysophospholipase L1-like esterase
LPVAADSKLRGFFAGALLSLVSVFLCLVAAEALFTMLYEKEQARLEEKKAGDIFCTSKSAFPELIYTRTPNRCGANSHGYRDYEYAYDKDDEVSRIVIIGDSVADGYGLELESSFGKVLEKELNGTRRKDHKRIEVIILAQGGYSTSQELFLLEHEAFKYSPDLIVWSYVLNDPAHPVYRGASGEVGDYFHEPRFHALHFVMDKLYKILEKFRSIGCGDEYHELLHCAYWSEVESNISNIAAVAGHKNTPVIFLIHPIIEENGHYDNYYLSPLHAQLGEEASKVGLYVLDLLPEYTPYDPAELTIPSDLWHDIWHPNEKGHRIVARALLAYIEQRPDLLARLGR